MIGLIFIMGSEILEVRIVANQVLFRTPGSAFATIDGLNLKKSGVIKQFPDLTDKEDWKDQAIKRFKQKIKQMTSEKETMNYIIEDLHSHGYKIKAKQIAGHRVIKYK